VAAAGRSAAAVQRRGVHAARECTLTARSLPGASSGYLLVGRRRLPRASATPLTKGALRSLP